MPVSAMSARLGAEPQCDWVDQHLHNLQARAQSAQHRLLIAGSRDGVPRSGLMAAQIPRGIQWGMALGRYPTTAVRDVTVALAAVLVDDQIVAPLLRMGRRARRPAAAPAPQEPGHRPHHGARARRPERMFENGLVLMWGTGQAVLATPLNAAVVAATLVGAALGAAAGCVLAVVVGVTAPRSLLTRMCPSLAILTHLTSNFELIALAQEARRRAQAKPHDSRLHARAQALWQRVEAQLHKHDAAIGALSAGQSVDWETSARALETQLLTMPRTGQFLGLGAYPQDNVDRLLQARAAFDAQEPWAQAPAGPDPEEYDSDS